MLSEKIKTLEDANFLDMMKDEGVQVVNFDRVHTVRLMKDGQVIEADATQLWQKEN